MKVKHFFNVLKRRSLVAWSVFAVGLALLFALRNLVPNTFVGVSHVALVTDSGGRDPSVGIVDLPSIATSSIVLQRVRNTLKLPISLVDFKLDVGAAVLGRSSIMAISYHDLSAERAIDVSNALADELSRYYDEISTSRYNVDVDRLSGELVDQSKKISVIEDKIGRVVTRNPFVSSDQSINTLTTQLATLSAQRADAFGTLQGDAAIAATLAPNRELAKTARHEILVADPNYTAVRTLAATDNAQLANDEAGYSKNFPGLRGAIAKVESDNQYSAQVVKRALADPNAFSTTQATTIALRAHQAAVVTGDESHVVQLDALIATEQRSLNDFPTSAKQYDQFRSERDALQSEYVALAARRANALANRAEASSLGNVVVLDRAIKADTQLTGGRTRAAILSLILILAFAIGAAFMVESLDPRIRRAEEIEELYGIPVVARFGAKA